MLCLTISDTELYTPQCEREPNAMVRVPWRHYWRLHPGTFVDVTLVYNKWNSWYIVADYSVPTDIDGRPFYGTIPYEIFLSEFDGETKMVKVGVFEYSTAMLLLFVRVFSC